ncbi:hypothetical protein AALO_G00242350 [Alosa alosa]|uniref:Reverse transcriptase n=1 Tax=Alosa alosa TaxID=278164 RepID=A0AAV6FRT1_9TELE|nr:hypothetical protein AALO_G00242350 [Alosa alosa]
MSHPRPKKPHPSELNDYRPVALTSHVMKTMERLVLGMLRPQVRHALDPLQFAYQEKVGVDNAITYLLHRTHSHLDKGKSAVRIMFFDFSSAFNTIQPLRLGDKLLQMGVDAHLVTWITDYLTEQPQFVRLKNCLSDTVISSTGAPQGTVLSRTNRRRSTGAWWRTVQWCKLNHLQLNTSKTKEMVVDFRRSKPTLLPVSIDGVNLEVVSTYKYLGLHLDNKLDWSANTDALYKKGQSRLYFLRRLRSFNKPCPKHASSRKPTISKHKGFVDTKIGGSTSRSGRHGYPNTMSVMRVPAQSQLSHGYSQNSLHRSISQLIDQADRKSLMDDGVWDTEVQGTDSGMFIADEELVETIKELSSVGSVRKEHTTFTDTHL